MTTPSTAQNAFISLNRSFFPILDAQETADPETMLRLAGQLGQTKSWKEILRTKHVVILGEAGSGKTTELQMQARSLRSQGQPAFFVPMVELSNIGIAECLTAEEQQSFTDWKSGDETGFFFLDAVDEAKLSNTTLRASLVRFRSDLGEQVFRTSLVISSRVSDWHFSADLHIVQDHARRSLTDGADGAEASVSVVQLAPLDRKQISLLAAHQGLSDVDEFLAALRTADAWPLAQCPLDAIYMARHWHETGVLGSLQDLLETNIRRGIEERPKRPSKLDVQRARRGAEVLAACATLTGRVLFLLPENAEADTPDRLAVDPGQVLNDWSHDDQRELLTRGLFDVGTYGRVRIHHRAVQEYLAARWVAGLKDNGLSDKNLRRLLFRKANGAVVVPRHLSKLAAWLSLWNRCVREQLLNAAPEHLLDEGDPSCLPVEVKRRILDQYFERYGGRRVDHWFGRGGLARFATPDLASYIDERLCSVEPGPCMELLLQLVRWGRLAQCVSNALRIAHDVNVHEDLRHDAIYAVAEAGTAEDRRRLLEGIPQPPEPLMIAGLVETLFPDQLDVKDLLRLLRSMDTLRCDRQSFLDSAFSYHVPSKCPDGWRSELVAGLWEILSENAADSSGTEGVLEQSSTQWLVLSLAKLVAAELEHREDPATCSEPVLQALRALGHLRHAPVTPHTTEPVQRAVEGHPLIRQWLFWDLAAQRTNETGNRPTYGYQVHKWNDLMTPGSGDVDWLRDDASHRQLPEERLLAFDVLLQLPLLGRDNDQRRAAVERLATNDELLSQRLTEFRAQREVPYGNPDLSQIRQDREQQAIENKAKIRSELETVLPAIRSGEQTNAFISLLGLNEGAGDDWDTLPLQQIKDDYGDEVLEALQQGLRNFWRNNDPGLPYGSNAMQYPMYSVGLAGLALEKQQGVVHGSLPQPLAERATRYAIRQLNGFPKWLTGVAEAQPVTIASALFPALEAEFSKPGRGRILDKLPYAAVPVRRAVAPILNSLLEQFDLRFPATLENTIEVLIEEPDLVRESLVQLIPQRCQSSEPNSELWLLWWSFWLNTNSQGALAYLTDHLQLSSELEAVALIQSICDRIYEWTDSYSQEIDLPIRHDVEGLSGFIRVVYQHVRPGDDVDHHHGSRVQAQRVRSTLVNWLSQIDDPEALVALNDLAGDALLPSSSRNFFLRRADEHAATLGASAPWTVDRFLEWHSGFVLEPTTSSELVCLTLDRLDDVADFVYGASSDFCYRELFTMEEVLEKHLQLWLASELEWRSKGKYHVAREQEVDLANRPDIRLRSLRGEGLVSLELKVAEQWSGPELQRHLKEQLVDQYMRTAASSSGIYVLCSAGRPIRKAWRPHGRGDLSFEELVCHLNEVAARMAANSDEIDNLRVVGINFRRTSLS